MNYNEFLTTVITTDMSNRADDLSSLSQRPNAWRADDHVIAGRQPAPGSPRYRRAGGRDWLAAQNRARNARRRLRRGAMLERMAAVPAIGRKRDRDRRGQYSHSYCSG